MITKAEKPIADEPPLSHQSPSVKFTAFAVAITKIEAQITQTSLPIEMPGRSARVNAMTGLVCAQYIDITAKPQATTRRPTILADLLSPKFRSRLTLIQSSIKPTPLAATIAAMRTRPDRVKIVSERMWLTR